MTSSRDDEGGPRSKRGHRALAGRGREAQAQSAFSSILTNLLEATPLAPGAALVDFEGETVDFSGTMEAFDLKVTAAHVRILLEELAAAGPTRTLREVRVAARERGYVIRVLDASYALVLVTHARGAFAASSRAIDEASIRLCGEASLPRPPDVGSWFRVEVETGGSARRPVRLRFPSSVAHLGAPTTSRRRREPPGGFSHPPLSLRLESAATWTDLEILGALLPRIARRADTRRGFRVRLSNGAELTLVAEPGGLWFVDEAPWAIFGPPATPG